MTCVGRRVSDTHKACTVLTEGGLDVGGVSEAVDKAHLTVEQRAGFHEVINHLFTTDLPIPDTNTEGRGRERVGENV